MSHQMENFMIQNIFQKMIYPLEGPEQGSGSDREAIGEGPSSNRG